MVIVESFLKGVRVSEDSEIKKKKNQTDTRKTVIIQGIIHHLSFAFNKGNISFISTLALNLLYPVVYMYTHTHHK